MIKTIKTINIKKGIAHSFFSLSLAKLVCFINPVMFNKLFYWNGQ